jgi:hypothetical protein
MSAVRATELVRTRVGERQMTRKETQARWSLLSRSEWGEAFMILREPSSSYRFEGTSS